MVVRPRAAPAVDRLAVVRAQDVDLALVGEGLEGAVDRGESDLVAVGAQPGVQVLGGGEVVHPTESIGDRGLLPGEPPRVLRQAGHG
jgi:hypothetical protein